MNFTRFATTIAAALLCLGFEHGFGQGESSDPPAAQPDKQGYTLFRPTPRELLRELSTDRPDQTESPFTVDAGHIQAELDFANAIFDQLDTDSGSSHTTEWGLAPFNFKVGLLNRLDLQLIFDTYVNAEEDAPGQAADQGTSGTGDLVTRVKVNLWGNDGGATAFAVMPFIKWPIAESGLGNDYVESGVILPLGVELSERWGLGLMTEFDFVRDEADLGPITEFVNSATVGCAVTPRLGMYVEFFSVIPSNAPSDWLGQADFGVTLAAGDNVRFDLGCNFGVTDSAPDTNPFLGLSFRL